MTHLPPPSLPRFGGGERPPFSCKPPVPLTITMGQRPIFRPIIVLTALRCPKKSSHYSFARFFRPLRILCLASSATGGARLRIPIPRDSPPSQALTPRERHPRFLIARPSEPLSRHRERGWGERADALRLPWERFCAQYGLIFGSTVNQSVSSTASDRGLGAAPQAYFAYFCTHKSRPPPGRRAD